MRRLHLRAVVIAFAALAVTAPSASAAVTYTEIKSKQSQKFLEVAGWSLQSGAAVQQWGPSGTDYTPGANQLWSALADDETGPLRNKYSQNCLTTDGTPGHQLYQNPCDGGWGQRWTRRVEWDWSKFQWITTYHNPATALYLDVSGSSTSNGAAIVGWRWNGGFNQIWWGN